jgi:UDP-3-O-[3-hydroxymyristoyl] glucosamine N-acyltransferase
MKLKELADLLGAELDGPGELDISGAAGVRDATEGQLTFIADDAHLRELEHSRASAVLVPEKAKTAGRPCLRVKNPRLAFARVLGLFYVPPYRASGVSDRAVVGKEVDIGADPSVHACVVLGDGARLGDRVTLHPGVSVGKGATIGDDTVVHPNACIGDGVTVGRRVVIHAGTVLGSDGFGFTTDGGVHYKIPQVGVVIVEDDVEIGANCAIDRATLGATTVRKGTKIDNLVHVAHNVTIGEYCLIAGQVGIAGSCTLGSHVVLGGQVGIADHVSMGDGAMAGGGTAVTRDVAAGQVVAGYYAMPMREWLKVQAMLPRLPEFRKQLSEITKRLEALQQDEGKPKR